MTQSLIAQIQHIGSGVAIILIPLIFSFAFALHPGLGRPRLLRPEEIIRRARRNPWLQFGHSLVLLSTALLIVLAITWMQRLSQTGAAWAGMVGGGLAILGSILLAADKGAFCLTMSALDCLPEETFPGMMPGLLAIFEKKGWMKLLWGMALLPVGFAILALGLLQSGALPAWQSILFLIGVLLVAIPDGLEIVNLSASILMAGALIPFGIQLITSAS